MKKILICLSVFFMAATVAAQDATLTKAETISYLDKKIKAIVGQPEPFCSSCTGRKMRNAYVKEVDGLIEVFFSYDLRDDYIYSETYRFNPKYLRDVDIHSGSQTVRSINIFIPNESGMKTTSDYESFWKTKNVRFLFLDNDPENGKRIKKALLHLKDLYNAEADPFDN